VLEPDAPPQDFAFADTVFARELEGERIPPSRPLIVNEPWCEPHMLTPLAFPLPDSAGPDADLAARVRVLTARVRHGLRGALDELTELWTATDAGEPSRGGSRLSRVRVLAGRLRALWGCWEWERADLTRAAVIGLGVFVVAATIGVAATGAGAGPAATASGETSVVVRAPRTLEQHTSRNLTPRTKAEHVRSR
jgi:hypothetical protein